MYNQIITLVVLIAVVNSFPQGGNEVAINSDLGGEGTYETLAAPDVKMEQDDATYPRTIRLRNTRPRSFVAQLADRGVCPNGGPSLAIRCDPKRPWPACPPQSYCYATSSVELGEYYCCAV